MTFGSLKAATALGLCAAMGCAGTGAQSAVTLDHIQWRSDIRYDKPVRPAGPGTLQAFVTNKGAAAVSLDSITIGGVKAEDLKKNNEITWHRLLPASVAPGGVASVMVRMRTAPAVGTPAEIRFSDGSVIKTAINPQQQNPGFRIESVGFAPGGKRVVVYFKRQDIGAGGGIKSVSAACVGQALKTSWQAPKFAKDLAIVELASAKPLPVGDLLYIKGTSQAGRVSAYLIRISDGYIPLGTYDWPAGIEPERLATAGMTNATMHHAFTKEMLDPMQALGIRASAYSHFGAPKGLYATHPAMDTMLITDEPDVRDWAHYKDMKNAPAGDKRIGYSAQEVADGAQAVHEANKKLQAGVVMDLTFRPENYYEYGETIDVLYSDNYALTHGDKLDILYKMQAAAMSGAAPNPVVHIFDDCWQEQEGRGINRPKTASEQRRIMLYPFGEGAKGLIGWWNVTTREEKVAFHGAEDYPDQWNAMTEVFRSLRPLTPLMAVSCPIDAVSCADKQVWCRSLAAGGNALMLTAINEDFEYSHEKYLQSPAKNVVLKLESLPWFKPAAALRATATGFEKLPLTVNKDGSSSIKLGDIWVGEVVLVTSDPTMAGRLMAAYKQSQTPAAAALLQAPRDKAIAAALSAAVLRDLTLNRKSSLVTGAPIGGAIEEKNAQAELMPDRKGMSWGFKAPAGVLTAVVQAEKPGDGTSFVLFDQQRPEVPLTSALLDKRDLGQGWLALTFRVPQAGEYDLQAFKTGGGAASVGTDAYILPGMTLTDIANNRR